MTLPPRLKNLYGCAGCGRAFIKHKRKWITIEEYLDPERIIKFDNTRGMSPQFQQILNAEESQREMGNPFAEKGIVVDHMGTHLPWKALASQCMQKNYQEETLFTMVYALHDAYFNAGFWLNVAQMATFLTMFEVRDRALKAAYLAYPSNPDNHRIKTRLSQVESELSPQLKKSKKSKKYWALRYLADDNLRRNNVIRSKYRLQQLIDYDPTDVESQSQLESLSGTK